MKKLFLILAAASFFAACNSSGSSSNDEKKDSSNTMSNGNSAMESKREKNEKTALASVMAINSHDADAVLKDVTADATDYGDGSMAPMKGVDTIKSMIKGWMDAFEPKIENATAYSNADGSQVVVIGETSGTFKKDFMGMKATNKPYKVWDGDILTFNEDGKITSHRSIQAGTTMMMQVGAKMPK